MSTSPRRRITQIMTCLGAVIILGAGIAHMSSANSVAPLYSPVVHPEGFPTRSAAAHEASAVTSLAAGPPAKVLFWGDSNGGVSTAPPKVYLIFWGPRWGHQTLGADGNIRLGGDPKGVAPKVESLMKGLGTKGELWSGVMTQYCGGVAYGTTACKSWNPHVKYSTNVYLGLWVDSSAEASNVTESQIAAEANKAAKHFGRTTAASNLGIQYIIMSPTGAHPNFFNTKTGSICADHDDAGVAYIDLPYVPDLGGNCGAHYVNAGAAGVLDGLTMVAGHEYAEGITDQVPEGGWGDPTNNEIADKCVWHGVGGIGGAENLVLATGTFAMQSTFSNDTDRCQISHPIVHTIAHEFHIALSTSSITVHRGTSHNLTIASSVLAGTPQAISITLGGKPAGVTGSLTRNPIVAGTNTVLSVHVASSTKVGVYHLAVNGTSPNVMHADALTLTVT